MKPTLLLATLLGLLSIQAVSGQSQITLTSDQQVIDLMDPDKVLDISKGHTKVYASLRQVCESARAQGHDMLRIKYDAFYRQYRNQPETDRLLTVDSDEYIEKIKVIGDFAAQYGLGLGLPLLSPLELGSGYNKQTGKSGKWMHYKVANRDPQSGRFNVKLWQQLYWTNNKGKFDIKLKSVKAYAFREEAVPNSMFRAVNRDDILALDNVEYVQWEVPLTEDDSNMDIAMWDGTTTSPQTADKARQIEVYCEGSEELKGYDRVLVLLEYESPEMAYFDEVTVPWMKDMFKRYKDAGIKLVHLTNDEPHFQADWFYFNHHDNGQFAIRYFTPEMSKHYEKQYGIPFEEKDLLYFACGPDIESNSVMATSHVQYVKGITSKAIQETFLFRDNYYKMLNHHLVDIFTEVQAYSRELFGVDDWGTSGHASWAESPTVDYWDTRSLHRNAYKYEYTPAFVWGNTVQQAAAACYDYFKWGEYLSPTRNDFAELGWVDRNYYAAAMATSIGVINKVPFAHPHIWGHPQEVYRRKTAVNDAFGGNQQAHTLNMIAGKVHRDVDVLVLYPMNLVAADERFGSWMTQYGYCNFITAEKLLELGSVNEQGELIILDKTYSTLVSLFEPLPNKGLLSLMEKLVDKGGKALWFGPPPLINDQGEACLTAWENLFGVTYEAPEPQGRIAVGMRIDFDGPMKEIPPQYILTDYLVDRIYPLNAQEGTIPLAYCDNDLLVGAGKGNAYCFGFRPRDDQSGSLGYETRTLFEILDHAGAYAPTGKFPGVNDNTEHQSRNSDYLCTRFPNGTTVVVKHYKDHRENWGSNNSRNAEEDAAWLAENPLDSDQVRLENFKVNGHEITYDGRLTMTFRTNALGELIAFDGRNCDQLNLDGKVYTFSNKKLKQLAFAPSENNSGMHIYVKGDGSINIPLPAGTSTKKTRVEDENGKKVKHQMEENYLVLNLGDASSEQWLTIVW